MTPEEQAKYKARKKEEKKRENKKKGKKDGNYKGYSIFSRILAFILLAAMVFSVCATLITYLIAA